MAEYTITNVTWYEDANGPYWSADLAKGGHIIGGIGSYYEVEGPEGNAQRPNKESQEADVAKLLLEGLHG